MKKINNKEFYETAINKYGVSPRGVHWNSKNSQYKRFEAITSFIKKDIINSTLLDVGCGFGEYYKYLSINNKLPAKYIGIDCEKSMIDLANTRFPNQKFIIKDVLKDNLIHSDYLICSGALNILDIDQIDIFIKKSFEHCNKGFIFNFLKNVTFTVIKKDEIIDITKRYTKNMIIKEDYLDNDFTIFMVK